MKIFNKILCVFTLLSVFVVYVNAKAASSYESEILNKSSSLSQIKDIIKQKKSEKEIIKEEEFVLKKELKKIKNQIEVAEKNILKLSSKIVTAQSNLLQASFQVEKASKDKNMWGSSLNSAALYWQEEYFIAKPFFEKTVSEEVVISQLIKDKLEFVNAGLRADKYKQAFLKWQSAKAALAFLKEEQQVELLNIANTKKQRQELLNTTTGRRIEAEEEIKRLTQSAKELELLISKLDNARRASAEKSRVTVKVAKAYASLPWPIYGSVVVKFGKNKHPQLDTYIISNGIKIKPKTDISVKSVSNGQVVFAGEFRAYGKMVIVDNEGSLYTIYGGFDLINVKEGVKLKTGEEIGLLNKNEPTLYFEVRLDNKPQDPLLWLKQ